MNRFFKTENYRKTSWVMTVLVFLLALLCYWPAMYGELLWDDPAHVTKEHLRSIEGLWKIWTEVLATQQYYPVTHSTFWIQYQLWGDSTFAYHLANVLQHAANACLFAWLLRRLWSSGSRATAAVSGPALGTEWIAAILFVAHPVFVESVAWISEQKNTLSLLFYLLAAHALLSFDKTRRPGFYLLATLLFVLALGSKTVSATLPAAFLVAMWWREGSLSWNRHVLPVLPWFGLAAVAGLSTVWIEANLIGASGDGYELSLVERTLLAGRILWFYVGSIIWPLNLSFFYELWDVQEQAYEWVGYLIAAVAVTFGLWAIRKKTRGPLAIWLLFAGSLFPALGFFNVFPFAFSYVADHFQYLASLSIIAGSAVCIAYASRKVSEKGQMVGTVVFVALTLSLIGLSREQSSHYSDNETLFRASIESVPNNWMAHRILAGAISIEPGRVEEAMHHYGRAIELNPSSPDAHYGYGTMLAYDPARIDEAISHYKRAIELRPNFAEALTAVGAELARDPARHAEAIEHFEKALEEKPFLAITHYQLAKVLVQSPDTWPEGMSHYEEALLHDENNAIFHYAYGRELAKIPPQHEKAVRYLKKSLSLNPGLVGAYVDLARILSISPRGIEEAMSLYETALTIDPDNVDTINGIAIIFARKGQFDQAKKLWLKTLQIDPGFEAAKQHLIRLAELQ